MTENDKDLAKELDPELLQKMETLMVLFNGTKEDWDDFFQGETEGHFFSATGKKSELEAKALTCGIQLMFGVLEQSKPDAEDLVREYTIIGIKFTGSMLDVFTGLISVADEKFIIGIEKDYPEEFIFLAIEMNPDVAYIIESAPQDEGDDGVEIFINREEDIRVSNN